MRKFLYLLLVAAFMANLPTRAQFTVTATPAELRFRFDTRDAFRSVAEVAPYDDSATNILSTFLAPVKKLSIPRFDASRDRIYSGFILLDKGAPVGVLHFAQIGPRISKYHTPYPRTRSKKGLQVQMVDDAIALGVQHAALNFDFARSIKLNPDPNDFRWQMDGRDFWFDSDYISGIDQEVKPLSDSGAAVTLILVNWVRPGLASEKVALHPHYDPKCPEGVSAFNTSTPDGVAWFKACAEFLAERYSHPGFPHGRVVNFIVGNEVNSHWYWDNMGHVSMEQFAHDYIRAVRLCDIAVRKFSATDRVFISLEHDWNIRYSELDSTQGFPAHAFIEYFNRLSKKTGDFEWNVAYHPYPENLFDGRTWLDKDAIDSTNSPMITFRNIQVLPQYMSRRELRYHGAPRRIILSEQGFHSSGTAASEQLQAAAYCYAWRKIVNLKGIDAFILHRHVDFRYEGGLNLGLWRNDPNSPLPSQPLSRKPIYYVFKAADTPQWRSAFAFALPIIGIKSWDDLNR